MYKKVGFFFNLKVLQLNFPKEEKKICVGSGKSLPYVKPIFSKRIHERRSCLAPEVLHMSASLIAGMQQRFNLVCGCYFIKQAKVVVFFETKIF